MLTIKEIKRLREYYADGTPKDMCCTCAGTNLTTINAEINLIHCNECGRQGEPI